MIFVADAHRSEGDRYIVRADEELTAFLELELRLEVTANCLDKRTRPPETSCL